MLASALSVAGAANAYEEAVNVSLDENVSLHSVEQKTVKVSGVVVDASGLPIIGANVIVKGSAVGSITGIDGDFVIPEAPKNGTLIVSYIGYVTKEVSGKHSANPV